MFSNYCKDNILGLEKFLFNTKFLFFKTRFIMSLVYIQKFRITWGRILGYNITRDATKKKG